MAALDGGGIYVDQDSTATLTDVTLSGNRALDGGAIWVASDATAVLSNSTASGNSALLRGGGMLTVGNTTVVQSLISDNAANADFGYGGGIYVSGGLAVLVESTVANNSAIKGGGIATYNGPLRLISTTVSGNLGNGVSLMAEYSYHPDVLLTHSTVSGNSPTESPRGPWVQS